MSGLPTKYHIGCGSMILEDYLNIDMDLSALNLSIKNDIYTKINKNTWVLQKDIRSGLVSNNSPITIIYHCHFLEHLNRDEGWNFLNNCYGILSTGGYMRISVPDLSIWCRHYLEKNNNFFSVIREITGNPMDPYSQTNAATFNLMLYRFGHLWLYDYESLSIMLSMIGFKNITRKQWGSSNVIKYMDKIESKENPKSLETLVIECTK